MEIRSRLEKDTEIAEMMYVCVKLLYRSLFSLCDMELNSVGRHKFGYIQQRVFSSSRTDLDQLTTLMLLKVCHDVCFCEVSLQLSGLFIPEKLS